LKKNYLKFTHANGFKAKAINVFFFQKHKPLMDPSLQTSLDNLPSDFISKALKTIASRHKCDDTFPKTQFFWFF